MILFLFLLVLNLFKLLVTPAFPLIGDEAYYWLWSRHLAFGYVDHPPMIAYLNLLIGQSEFGVRLAAILIVLLISWLIYLTAKELFDRQAAVIAVVVFNLLPTFFGGGMILVPQTIFFLFWTLAFYFFIKLTKTGQGYYWLLIGLAGGLGLLSDYIMAFFFLGAALYIVTNPKLRFWLTKPEPYLGLFLSLILVFPMAHWYFTHLASTAGYQGSRVANFSFSNLFYFVVLQMVMFTPPVFLAAARRSIFDVFTGIIFLPFALLSPFMMVGGHWLSAAYLPSILESARQKRWVLITTIVFALTINALAFTYYVFLYPTGGLTAQVNRELPKYLKSLEPTYVYSNNLGLGALVSFHGQVPIYLPPGRHAQYDLWGRPALKKGDNIIYFALNESELPAKLRPLFQNVTLDPRKRVFTKDGDIATKTEIIICRGYLGQGMIP